MTAEREPEEPTRGEASAAPEAGADARVREARADGGVPTEADADDGAPTEAGADARAREAGAEGCAPTEADAEGGTPPAAAPSARAEHAAAAFLRRNRARLARLALVVIVVAVLLDLSSVFPADTDLRLALGDRHRDVVALTIDVLDEHEAPVRTTRLRYADGAPAVIEEHVELPPGRYVVRVEAEERRGARWALEGPLEAPADGAVRVPLRPVE